MWPGGPNSSWSAETERCECSIGYSNSMSNGTATTNPPPPSSVSWHEVRKPWLHVCGRKRMCPRVFLCVLVYAHVIVCVCVCTHTFSIVCCRTSSAGLARLAQSVLAAVTCRCPVRVCICAHATVCVYARVHVCLRVCVHKVTRCWMWHSMLLDVYRIEAGITWLVARAAAIKRAVPQRPDMHCRRGIQTWPCHAATDILTLLCMHPHVRHVRRHACTHTCTHALT